MRGFAIGWWYMAQFQHVSQPLPQLQNRRSAKVRIEVFDPIFVGNGNGYRATFTQSQAPFLP